MFRSSFWRHVAIAVSLVLFLMISLPLTMLPQAAMAATRKAATTATVTLSPSSGLPNSWFKANGYGWPTGDYVDVYWYNIAGPVAGGYPDNSGNFVFNIQVINYVHPGTYQLLFEAIDGWTGQKTDVYKTFQITGVTAQKAWTTDGNGNNTSAFVSVEKNRYYVQVTNTSSSTLSATFAFLATGPQQIFSWSGSGNVPPGTVWFYSPSSIPSNAPAGTYTLKVTVTFNGFSSQGQSQFTVKWRNRVASNPYPDSSQCTWFAEEQMHTATGLYMPNFSDAHSWRDNAGPNGWTVGTTPETASVMVMQYANGYKYWYWNGSQWVQTSISTVGHVGWVTSIGNNGSSVYIVDRNWNLDGKDGGRWIWISGAPVNFIYSSH